MTRLNSLCPAFISEEQLKKLALIGIKTLDQFLDSPTSALSEKTNIQYSELQSIRQNIISSFAGKAILANNFFDEDQSLLHFSCGSLALDEVLNGGVYQKQLTELVGPTASGKTQFCMSTAAQAACRSENVTVLYIDTTNSFSPYRIFNIYRAQNKDMNAALEYLSRIHCINVFKAEDLIQQLLLILSQLSSQSNPFYKNLKLLIVDSIGSVMSPIVGSSKDNRRSYTLMSHISRLLKTIAINFDAAVLITNYIVSTGTHKTKPALGETWTHVSNTQLLLDLDSSLTESPCRIAKLTKSPTRPLGIQVQFQIDAFGISDITLENVS